MVSSLRDSVDWGRGGYGKGEDAAKECRPPTFLLPSLPERILCPDVLECPQVLPCQALLTLESQLPFGLWSIAKHST